MKKNLICMLLMVVISISGFAKVNITDEPYNADNTGVNDCTNIFTAALIAETHVYVPAGLYRIDGIIAVNGHTLELENGAVLKRIKAFTANTAPVARLNKSFSCLIGLGSIITENDSPKGVVQIGHKDIETAEIFLKNCKIYSINVQGILNQANKGVALYSSQPFTKLGQTIQNIVDGVFIKDVDVAVYLGTEVNGSTISNIQGYNIEKFLFHLNGNENPDDTMRCRENIIENSFLHGSPTIDYILKMEKSQRNFIHGIQSDGIRLGDAGAPPFAYLDKETKLNMIIGTAHGARKTKDLGAYNTFYVMEAIESALKVTKITTSRIDMPYSKWNYIFIGKDVAGDFLKISGIKVNDWAEGNDDPMIVPIEEDYVAGVYYRITISGFAKDNEKIRTYTYEYIVNTFNPEPGKPMIDCEELSKDNDRHRVFVDQDDQSITIRLPGFAGAEAGKICVNIEAIFGSFNWPVNNPTVEFLENPPMRDSR